MGAPGSLMTEIAEHFFESRELASIAAAECIVAALRPQLEQHRATSLVVTGGSSPARCYAVLAATAIGWSRVHVLLSDERWVPATDPDSNEKLVRDTLLVEQAADARLHSIYAADTSPAQRCQALDALLPTLPLPFASVLLGMGDDGHFASLFPDAANLAAGLAPDNPAFCIPVRTAASEHQRISMTLAALLQSEQIVLLFFGAAKRAVYERARAESSTYPVAKLFSQERTPVHVFWAA